MAKMTGKRKKAAAAETLAVGIDHSKYERTRFTDPKTGRARSSVSNGDAVARAMMHLVGEDAIDTCARRNKLKDEVADKKFPNPGMKRMALGNRLRAMVRKGEAVTIGAHEVKTLLQRVPLPEGGEAKAKPAKKVAAAREAKPKKRPGLRRGKATAQDVPAEAAE